MEDFIVKGSRKSALFFSTLAFFVGFAGVSAYGPIVPMLKKTLNLNPFLMSLLAAAPALTGSLLRIPFGAMVDKAGGKRPILALIFLSIFGIAGMSWLTAMEPSKQAEFYGWFIGFGLLAGSGIAIFSVGVPTVAYWHPQRTQGSALALYGGLGNTAPGLFAMMLPLLIANFGFSVSYMIWLLMLVIAGMAISLLMYDAPSFQYKANGHNVSHEHLLNKHMQELVPSGKAFASLKTASSDWNTWALTGIYFATFGGFIALTAWGPTFWTQGFGMSLVVAGGLTAVYSLSTSIMRVCGGFLSDKFGGEKILALSIFIMLAGSSSMVVSGNAGFAFALAAAIVMAIGMGIANAAVFKLVPKFAPNCVGGSAGIVGGLGAFGGFVIPLTLGSFVSRYENAYTQAFVIFIILAIASLILFKTLKRVNR
jgi:NNP family nitrate/nitrite transporter-like MFS transporter